MSLRKLIFWIHLITGCLAGVVIVFLSITGCVLAYEKQITALAERGYRTSASSESRPLEQLLSRAAQTEGKAPSSISVSADLLEPVEVDFGKEDRLFLNRYSGAVLGHGAVRTRQFFVTVTELHRWFGAAANHKAAARAVKGVFNTALLLMIVTGLCLWWPLRWSWSRLKAGVLLRSGLKGRAWEWNRHSVFGLWFAIPLAVVVLTGMILSYSWATNLLYRMAGSPPPSESKMAMASEERKQERKPGSKDKGSKQEYLSLDQLFQSARRQAIDARTLTAILPKDGAGKVTFVVDFDHGSRPDQKAQLVFDRNTGAVVKLETFSSYNLGRRLRLFVKFVHTGEAGGLLGETINGIASLACVFLVWTGVSMSLRRLRTYFAKKKKKQAELQMANL